MKEILTETCSDSGCDCHSKSVSSGLGILSEINTAKGQTSACCGTSSGDVHTPNPFVRAGYEIMHFVDEFIETPVGNVPKVKTSLGMKDHFGTLRARSGIGRDNYLVSPGLYCTGNPDEDSPVLVTANYKLSLDHLRRELDGMDAWMIVLDTLGVNVWCAAGKGTFSTKELVNRIHSTGIEKLVNHRKLILPQLGATGVSGFQVKRQAGFKVIWGPIRASDIKAFVRNGMKVDKEMREVTFSVMERALLIPVEVKIALKPALMILVALFILSGIGPGVFSFSNAMSRGGAVSMALITGILAGAVFAPLFLTRLYGTAFSVKGIVTGLITGIPVAVFYGGNYGVSGMLSLLLICLAVSSYLSMNFTGTTPYTSPSGVELEMRRAIPAQSAGLILGIILWIFTGF